MAQPPGLAPHKPPTRPAPTEEATDAGPCPHDSPPGRSCRPCAQLRRRAWRLVDRDHMTYQAAAQRMNLSVARVRALVVDERDRQDLGRYKLDSIPTERVRAFLERELARDPELTHAEVAHWLGITQADLHRQLGYATGNKRPQQRIGIPAASRLAIALGRAPNELDGC